MSLFGLYLPYNDNSKDCMDLYLDTLDKLQCLIDDNSSDTPILVLGDMNTPLPNTTSIPRNWFRNRPYSRRSAVLYDFVLNNEMCVANFMNKQVINYTYFKGNTISYIDHIFVPIYISSMIRNCVILHNSPDNVSDHMAISMTLDLPIKNPITERKSESQSKCVPDFPKPMWQDRNYLNRYVHHLNEKFNTVCWSSANLDNINIDNARSYVNDLHDSIRNAIHEATRNCSEEFSKKKSKHGKQWWTGDCTKARERNRLFFHIWKSVGRPKDGVTYDCYRASRKAY